MTEVTGHLVLVVNDNTISAWHLVSGKSPQNIPVHGETFFSTSSADEVYNALLDIKDNINGRGLNTDHYHWLADRQTRQQLIASQHRFDLFGEYINWQLVSLEWLAGRFGRKAGELDSHFIKQELL